MLKNYGYKNVMSNFENYLSVHFCLFSSINRIRQLVVLVKASIHSLVKALHTLPNNLILFIRNL